MTLSSDPTKGPTCPMCGGPQHKTKAAVLACSGARRRELAELAALVRPNPKPKEGTHGS